MRKIYFRIAFSAIFVIICASCGSSKSTSQSSNSLDEIEKEIALTKKQMELETAKAEAERNRKNLEAQSQLTPQLKPGSGILLIPCKELSYDKRGEYMAGLGIVDDRPDMTRALLDANQIAIAEIASRYIGMIKNAIESYSKDVNVPSNKKLYESGIEGGVAAIGTKVIDKYASAVCREYAMNATGSYMGYVAVHVYLEDAQKGLAEELEVRKVDYDKKKFFEKMNAELDAEAARQKAELEQN